ncbi:alpha/beta-type small acid-soluble spore protein [Halobacillus salinarum]|uniref:Alpha/beta-type small acid-soluble spore protein n=1 Tax=Halobacillus salinarum TaxID=2932257 RepID=A0ABY4ENG2_9BACI|nr:alpha/beta-type small acid-soluble spore protein [Halobacillus salinarum]UOQ46000.1 alpha/beta-type small acid-soluble spore protein [Halobacillus salinarum]
MSRRNKILVPEAREGLDKLKAELTKQSSPENAKYEIANQKGIPLNEGYNGQLTSKQAGEIGGNIGGSMVRELIRRAEQQLKDNQ